jgi:predicted dehydrogenase
MIGCGAIARQYLDTARRLDAIEIVAAADRVPARATAVEAAEGIPAMPVADLLANAEVDVVLNLTIPAAHAAIALQAIAAGKAVYGEKPLAATTAEARSILEAAGAAGADRLRARHGPGNGDPDGAEGRRRRTDRGPDRGDRDHGHARL